MNKKDISSLGYEIRDIIKNSINTGDYRKMGQDVGGTVNSALEMAFEEVRKAIGSIQVESQKFKTNPTMQPPIQNKVSRPVYQPLKKSSQTQGRQIVPRAEYFPHAPVGKVKGTLMTVFGSIGTVTFGMSAIIIGALGGNLPILAIMLALLGPSLIMDIRGTKIRDRIKRYKRYLSLFYGRVSCSIQELSIYTGFSERFLLKDLKKMIALGMFPEAHIDLKKSMILLNRESYNQYLTQQVESQPKQVEEQIVKESKNPELDKVIEEGRVYIQHINDAKYSIKDMEVSAKVYRMEEIISKIIGYVEEHPEKLSEVRRFMQYYLPTTLKLLNAYQEFDRQTIQGENIKTAKNEIKDALDTINLAFENLLDSLFESAAMDISTDISVLHTMLAQEGLTEQDFNTSKK